MGGGLVGGDEVRGDTGKTPPVSWKSGELSRVGLMIRITVYAKPALLSSSLR